VRGRENAFRLDRRDEEWEGMDWTKMGQVRDKRLVLLNTVNETSDTITFRESD
jgi:hypothetical protein